MINESGLPPPLKSVVAETPRNLPLSRVWGNGRRYATRRIIVISVFTVPCPEGNRDNGCEFKELKYRNV